MKRSSSTGHSSSSSAIRCSSQDKKSRCSRCQLLDQENGRLKTELSQLKAKLLAQMEEVEKWRSNPSKFRLVSLQIQSLLKDEEDKGKEEDSSGGYKSDSDDDERKKGIVTSFIRRPHKIVYTIKTNRENRQNYYPHEGHRRHSK